ncbi:MAG: shikimate kinase [Phycisphaeraceae bacterium]
MNIVLLGYRGSGKTTVGKKLAMQLWKTFVDTDVEICKRFDNATIAEIWETHGESAFRQTECEVVADFLKHRDQVIALGGGSVMQPAARQSIEQADETVRIYLKCDAAVLAQRLEADAATRASRPSLTTTGDAVTEIEAVLAERDPVYQAVADHVLDVTRLAPPDVIRHLIHRCL